MHATTFQLTVQSQRLLEGCSGGIDQATALVEISVSGSAAFATVSDDQIRIAAQSLCPEQPLFQIAESDWPTGFLVHADDLDDADALRLGQWVVALTVAIQRWGRDPVWRGRVIHADPQRIRLAIPWQREQFVGEALNLSLELLRRCVDPVSGGVAGALGQWLSTDSAPEPVRLSLHFGDHWDTLVTNGLAPNTQRFVQAGVALGMPFDILPNCAQIGWGANAQRFDMAFTGRTSWMASTVAHNKWKSKQVLANAAVPVPRGWIVREVDQAVHAVESDLGWPVVIKPSNQELGLGVVVNIPDADTLRRVFDRAAQHGSGNVIVEQYMPGDDHRLLVVNQKFIGAARRVPGRITGDGTRTVRELVDLVNADPRRGTGRYSLLKKLLLDDEATDCLAAYGLNFDSVPPAGQTIPLRRIANISSGGTADDLTDVVHPDNRLLAERVARVVGLDIAGIDFITPDISRSWRDVGGAVCEVNGQPGFRPHWLADPQRDINSEVLDALFDGQPARIPTAAITGTNGKTTTAEMLYRIWSAAGKVTGVCTTDVVRIGGEFITSDNFSGQPGARMILNDPGVEAAVFEMPRRGLLMFGHPCDRYDVAALLNVQDDHIGVDGIDSLDQMAELKAEVLQRARHAIVVNADDPRCMAMRSRAGTERHILVTDNPSDPAVADHRRSGGEAVFVGHHNGSAWIVLATGDQEQHLVPVDEIPATMNGLLRFNISNAMFAAALAWAQGVAAETIRHGLTSFHNSVDQNPGRYNFIEGLPFAVLVDFGHNPDGVLELCAIARKLPVSGRRILCSRNLGNRHATHYPAVAGALAETFDAIVLGCDPPYIRVSPDYAGLADPVTSMLSASHQHLLDGGVRPEVITTIPGVEQDSSELIRTALSEARPGDLVVVLDGYAKAVPVIERWRKSLS